MDDYISRAAVIDAVQQHRGDVLGGYEYDKGVAFVYAAAHNHITEVIKRLPSADVTPVRHGKWGKVNECSECGCQPWYERDIHFLHYCPNCGARMDGET